MTDPGASGLALAFHPVTPDRLPDLARFAERHGKFRYCSCMRWRMTSGAYQRATTANRVTALETLVREGTPVGVLAYVAAEPIGWCSIAPRETYLALERSRALARLDDTPVWSVTCFFVDRHQRRQGLTLGLLRAAVDYARTQGATVVEGYPVEPGARLYTYMGSPTTFLRAGFREVGHSPQGRRIMRKVLGVPHYSDGGAPLAAPPFA